MSAECSRQGIGDRAAGEEIECGGSVAGGGAFGDGWRLVHAVGGEERNQFVSVGAFLAAGEENDEAGERGSFLYQLVEEGSQLGLFVAELAAKMVHAADVRYRVVNGEGGAASEIGGCDVVVLREYPDEALFGRVQVCLLGAGGRGDADGLRERETELLQVLGRRRRRSAEAASGGGCQMTVYRMARWVARRFYGDGLGWEPVEEERAWVAQGTVVNVGWTMPTTLVSAPKCLATNRTARCLPPPYGTKWTRSCGAESSAARSFCGV